MNNKLLNTQIEALNREHGAKICQFYEKNGFDTIGYTGTVHKLRGDNFYPFRYYGVNSEARFSNRGINSGLKTITLEEAEQLVKTTYKIKDLAEGKIAIKFDKDKDDLEFLRKILKLAFPEDAYVPTGIGVYYHTANRNSNFESNLYWIDNPKDRIIVNLKEIIMEETNKAFPRVMLVSNQNNIKTSHKRVVITHKLGKYIAWSNVETFEEAEKITSTTRWGYAWELEEKPKFPFELKADDAQSIINIACPGWKGDLAARWGKSIVLNEAIIIEEQFYKAMRNTCTVPQNELFDKIFGKD